MSFRSCSEIAEFLSKLFQTYGALVVARGNADRGGAGTVALVVAAALTAISWLGDDHNWLVVVVVSAGLLAARLTGLNAHGGRARAGALVVALRLTAASRIGLDNNHGLTVTVSATDWGTGLLTVAVVGAAGGLATGLTAGAGVLLGHKDDLGLLVVSATGRAHRVAALALSTSDGGQVLEKV